MVKRSSLKDVDCSVAQTLEVVGEWWSLLIVRDVFLGVTRFDDLQSRLGIARNILTDRLQRLVAEGILARTQYSDRPPRYDYVLTEAGHDLWPVISALREWGDRWRSPDGLRSRVLHEGCGGLIKLTPVCERCGETVELANVEVVHRPPSRRRRARIGA